MKIEAYTTAGCFYCDQLKELFRRAEVEYTAIEVGPRYSKEQFRAENPTAVGYPHVVIDGEPVGGLVETAKIFLQKGLVASRKNEGFENK